MLTVIKEVKFNCLFNKTGASDKFEEEIEVSFKEMDYAESIQPGFFLTFLNHSAQCSLRCTIG